MLARAQYTTVLGVTAVAGLVGPAEQVREVAVVVVVVAAGEVTAVGAAVAAVEVEAGAVPSNAAGK